MTYEVNGHVLGTDDSEDVPLLDSASTYGEALDWAKRYVRHGDWGGYDALVICRDGEAVGGIDSDEDVYDEDESEDGAYYPDPHDALDPYDIELDF